MSVRPGDLQRAIEALERQLRDPAVRARHARLDALLDEAFVEIDTSGGVFGKAGVPARLPSERGVAFGAGPIRRLPVCVDAARVLYAATRRAGRDARRALRSSWWCRGADGHRRMVFRQGTSDTGAGTIGDSQITTQAYVPQ